MFVWIVIKCIGTASVLWFLINKGTVRENHDKPSNCQNQKKKKNKKKLHYMYSISCPYKLTLTLKRSVIKKYMLCLTNYHAGLASECRNKFKQQNAGFMRNGRAEVAKIFPFL